MCANFQPKAQLWLSRPKFAQKWILGLKFQKTNAGKRISILEIPCVPIFRQKGQLWFFEPKFAQKWLLGSEFKKSKCGFGISTSNIPSEPIFSKTRQLWIFWPKFGEITQFRVIFWLEYCWGCCGELGGGWNELSGGEWSLLELGAWFGWSWVHSNALLKVVLHTRLNVY